MHNQLGEGGFGLVYKGAIKVNEKRVDVAIKQLNTSGLQGHHEWVTEVHFLGMVDNPYLVKLIGYCADADERGIQRLLVYEYMPNKGLDDHLFRSVGPVLSWQTRVRVALGASKGLAYLHDDKGVIFRDFKTANILLDEAFNPKLSDFGLARQGPDAGKTHVTTGVKGTYGYAAPEYIQTGHLTFKSDVFSFGVVLLEILTGRRAMDRNRPRLEQRLLEWVKPFINDPRKFHLAMDPRLENIYPTKAAMKFATIAIQCLVKQPKARPKLIDIVEGLKKVLDMTNQWESQLLHSDVAAVEYLSASSSGGVVKASNRRCSEFGDRDAKPLPGGVFKASDRNSLDFTSDNAKPLPPGGVFKASNHRTTSSELSDNNAKPLPQGGVFKASSNHRTSSVESGDSNSAKSSPVAGSSIPRTGNSRGASWERPNPPAFPLPSIECSASGVEEGSGGLRLLRRPAARDPSISLEIALQGINPGTPERIGERKSVRTPTKMRYYLENNNNYSYPTPAA